MKVKEVERSVSACWSPHSYTDGVLLATGTAAHQVDITNLNASAPTSTIDVYDLNLSEPGLDMQVRASVTGHNKFHKLAWGGFGSGNLVGGCDNGIIEVYSINKMLNNELSLMTSPTRHTGPVKTLDFNPFQTNLLASGACESEIYIWDLNNLSTPMTPGAKPQPYEDVVWLAWNKQVQHILASTFGTRCIVWDLKKNAPVIKLTDSTSRVRWKVLAWHPDIATQLCLASEDDANPVIQLWDLRFATLPLKTLHGHNRGVLSLSWCNQDPDLLISSAKDNRILCWNPNSNEPNGEIVCEISNTQQWIFDVSWCPKNPLLIASCSCDNHTSIYSLMGTNNNQIETTNKIADSFPGMEQMNQVDMTASGSHQHNQSNVGNTAILLRKPPKWLRRPCGSSFAFGGKLITFGTNSSQTAGGDNTQQNSGVVIVSQVITEERLVERCREIQEALNSGDLSPLWEGKQDPIWPYLRATFEQEPILAIRSLLGYEQTQVSTSKGVNLQQNYGIDGLTDSMAILNQHDADSTSSGIPGDGNTLGFNSSNTISNQNGMTAFDSLSTLETSLEKDIPKFKISTDNDVNGRICRSLLMGSIEEAVEICLQEGRMADAIVLSMAAGPEILAKTQLRYFQESKGYLSYMIEALVTEDWKKVVSNCDLKSWKEALVAVLTHCKHQDLPALCEDLGARLEQEGGAEYLASAEICYIASGNIGPLIHKRTANTTLNSETIQDLVELVLVGERAMATRGETLNEASQAEVAYLMYNYADLLASQGHLDTALSFINDIQDECVMELKEQLYCALGYKTPQQQQGVMPQMQSQQQFQQQQHTQQFQQQLQLQQQQQIQQVQQPPSQPRLSHPRKTSIPIYQSTQATMGRPQQGIPLPGFNQQVQQIQGVQMGMTPGVPPLSSTGRTTPLGPPPPSVSSPGLARSTPSPLTSHGGMPAKKYVVDPSVSGGGGGYGIGNGNRSMMMPQQQQQPFYPSTSSNSTMYGGSMYQQQPSFYQPTTSSVDSLTSPPTSQLQPQPHSFNTSLSGFMAVNSQQQPPLMQAPPPTVPLAQTTNTATPGWNDPPMITAPPRNQLLRSCGEMSAVHAGTRKWDKVISSHAHAQAQSHSHLDHHNYSRQANKVEVGRQNPITHPLFGSTSPNTGGMPSHLQQQLLVSGVAPPQMGGGPPPQMGGAPPPQMGGGPPPQMGGGPPPQMGGGPPPQMGGAQPPHMGGTQPQHMGGAPPSQMGGAQPSHMGGAPPPQMGGAQPSHMGGAPPMQMGGGASQAAPTPPISSLHQQQYYQQAPNEMIYNAHLPQHQINGGSYVEEQQQRMVQQQPVVQKAPLPEQYARMQNIFEQLRLVCATKANNPQLKKKLDDISRKLEALYDSLRESKLSSSTISGLEELVRLIEGGDYRGALAQHTNMVSAGTDFSQIASFMPGLKSLIQSALQLGAYLN